MQLVVTRPEPQASRWVRGLRAKGVSATNLPLLSIRALTTPELCHSRENSSSYHAIMFVSPAAVDAFFNAKPPLPAAGTVRHLATGPGTVRALLQAGVALSDIDAPAEDAAQFDSEALWVVIGQQPWLGKQVLIVRGQGQTPGRDWLQERWLSLGAQVSTVLAYERGLPIWTAEQQAQAQAALRNDSAWLLSSSQAVRHWLQLCPDAPRHNPLCICTHERIADTTRALGFTRILQCKPTLDDVAALCHAK